MLWWTITALSAGLAYPFQLASLERYKMRNTFYGSLGGSFERPVSSCFCAAFRCGCWLSRHSHSPLVASLPSIGKALADTVTQGGDEIMGKIEGSNPGLGAAIVFALLMGGTSATLAALLYPAYQAVVLRWWSSGLRFGDIEIRSQLRMRQVYGAYARFVGYAILFSTVMGIGGAIALVLVGGVARSRKGHWRQLRQLLLDWLAVMLRPSVSRPFIGRLFCCRFGRWAWNRCNCPVFRRSRRSGPAVGQVRHSAKASPMR